MDWSISTFKGYLVCLVCISFTEFPAFNANSIDPDQTPRSAASDLGLHCLPMSLLWDARHKNVLSCKQNTGFLKKLTLSTFFLCPKKSKCLIQALFYKKNRNTV